LRKQIAEVLLLQEYAEKIWPKKGQKGFSKGKDTLARFLGVNAHTVRRWFSGGASPIGMPLIKLRYFLELLGHKISTLELIKEKTPALYGLGELLAFDVITMSYAISELGYTDQHSVFRLMHGNNSCTSEKELLIQKVCSDHKTALTKKREDVMSLFGLKKRETSKEVVPSKKEQPKSVSSIQMNRQFVIEAVGHGLLGLLPLMEQMASDEFGPEERKYLREVMGHDVTGRVVYALRKLTNERVREQLTGQGGHSER
jgi:hypothetical protein